MAKRKVDAVFPIVEVTWVDAEEIGDIGWNVRSDILRAAKKPCPTMRTVGYCVYHGDSHISVVNTLGPSESSRLDKIPTAFLLEVKYLTGKRDGA